MPYASAVGLRGEYVVSTQDQADTLFGMGINPHVECLISYLPNLDDFPFRRAAAAKPAADSEDKGRTWKESQDTQQEIELRRFSLIIEPSQPSVQLLINGLPGQVGFSTYVSGFRTNQELTL